LLLALDPLGGPIGLGRALRMGRGSRENERRDNRAGSCERSKE
jgi:hypothetical protein